MSKRPEFNEPVEIAKFWRNRRGEAICVSLEPFEGRAILHVRTYFTAPDRKLAPTKKGIAITVAKLPDLAAAVNKAAAKAAELGLLEGEKD